MKLHSITIRNLLSFSKAELAFQPLTVLVGPNGAGKSNLIRTLRMLRTSAQSEAKMPENAGDPHTWLRDVDGAPKKGSVTLSVETDTLAHQGPVTVERTINVATGRAPWHIETTSMHARGRDLDQALESDLDQWLSRVRFYDLQPALLRPSEPDGPNASRQAPIDGMLDEDLGNLTNILQQVNKPKNRQRTNSWLEQFLDQPARLEITQTEQGPAIIVRKQTQYGPERPRSPSGGTLEMLATGAILLQPTPPAAICLENPGQGFHPENLSLLAELLLEASRNTQVIITTHSAELLDFLWDMPEAIVVVEKGHKGGTTMSRLTKALAEEYDERYTLGELWTSGLIGGRSP